MYFNLFYKIIDKISSEAVNKNCFVLKRSNKSPMRYLKCSLCRADPNDDWMRKDRIQMKEINYEGYDLKFFDTY